MNLSIITKNNAANSKIGFSLKIDFRADWTHEFIPTAWELSKLIFVRVTLYSAIFLDLIKGNIIFLLE